MTYDDLEWLMGINFWGIVHGTKAFLPHLKAAGEGHVVNLSSVFGLLSIPTQSAYNAAKFGVTALGICLGAEEKDSGIRVSNIYPGEVDTPILVNRPTPVTEEHRQRILKPEDVAAAVLFVVTLPPHASVPELIIKPTSQVYV